MKRFLQVSLVLLALLALTFTALGVTPAYATATGASLIVNTATDEDASNSNCSLREAITAANTNADYNGCTGTGTYGADTITFADGLTPITLDVLYGQLPVVTSVIIITGNGAANTIIQANENPNTATYRVFEVDASGDLTLDKLTVKNGNISANYGGGVYNNGILKITNSTFSGNSTGLGGGGVSNRNTLTITNSTFSGNSAGGGGGVFNDTGTTTITNSTFSGNSASGGGGISNYGTAELKNTIVANSTSGGDCSGTITADTFNLDSDDSCGGATQKTSLEINLGALGNYSGSTQTFALLPGSAAIDAGDDTVCDDNPGPNNLDQRGVSRVGNGAACDVGAYESRGFTLTKTGGDNQSTGVNTMFTDPLSVTLNETGGSVLSGATIAFTAPSSGASITSTNETALTNASGIASISATANGTAGSYNVTASAVGASSVDLALSNNPTATVLSTNSQDGWILESGAHTSKGGTKSSTASTFRVGDDAADKQYRNILSFSTGSKLPDTATIIKVTLRVRKYGSVVGAVADPVKTFKGFLMYVKKGYFGKTSLEASDFQASTSGSHTYRSTPSLVSGWYDINLTTIKDHINKGSTYSGLTQIRLQFYTADNGNKKANYLQLYGGSSAYRPQLVVEYAP